MLNFNIRENEMELIYDIIICILIFNYLYIIMSEDIMM